MKVAQLPLLFITLTFLLLTACAESSQETENKSAEEGILPEPIVSDESAVGLESVMEEDGDGNQLLYNVRSDNRKKEGPFQRQSSEGILVEEAFFINGEYDEQRILYYATGDTQIVETYDTGKFNGPYRLFYPSGKLKMEGTYMDNEMQGVWKQYYESGGLLEEVTFSENEENGPFREYHKNGQLSVEGNYLDGDNEHGELYFYDTTGVLIKKMNCENGVCRTISKKE